MNIQKIQEVKDLSRMGIGDWGLGIGPIPNPQSPIPNPQKLRKTYKMK